MMRFATLLAFWIALGSLPAGAIILDAAVEPPAATIGDRLRYTITARGMGDIDLPLKLETPEPFEVLDARAENSAEGKKIVFTLTVFKTGKIPLPAYSVPFAGADGKTETAAAPPLTVEIRSVLKPGEKDPALMPLGDVAEPVFDWKKYIWPAAALGAVLAALGLLAHLLKKRKLKKAKNAPAGPVRTPLETALAALEKVESENLYAAGRAKEYFTLIANAIRIYLHEEYGIDVLEKTTTELSAAWPAALEEHRERVFYLLRTCDVAKFTKNIPGRDDATSALAVAVYFVKNSPKQKSLPPASPAR